MWGVEYMASGFGVGIGGAPLSFSVVGIGSAFCETFTERHVVHLRGMLLFNEPSPWLT